MKLHPLTAISPIDGRYGGKTADLRPLFSEYGLIQRRVLVEIRWLQTLAAETSVSDVPAIGGEAGRHLQDIVDQFSLEDAENIKDIETTTQHDVKAVEYFIKEKIGGDRTLSGVAEFCHFACTSEDINNLAYGIALADARTLLVIALEALARDLAELAERYAAQPMLARTHGQPASPTTLGKEIAIFIHRLLGQIGQLQAVSIKGKWNGAVGNYNAHLAAYPDVNWPALSERMVTSVGLEWNPHTTQIEPHDYMAEYFHALVRINNILVDLCRDVWGYISLGYFRQRIKEGEVGSSTMPHKVNPIDFENAEGNLGLASSQLEYLASKLTVSRWQRDLTDSTTLRNIGVALGHCLIAYQSCSRGTGKLEADAERINSDLDHAWDVLAEAVQTVMRRHGIDQPYEKLKALTRGERIDANAMRRFIDSLELPAQAKQELAALTPADYVGNAESQARRIIAAVR